MAASPTSTPASEKDLLERASNLAGKSLAELAQVHAIPIPANLDRKKGWVGELIEQALGASQGSAAGPDFPEWGIELKTLPIKADGLVKETTFVCTVPLTGSIGERWTDTNLYQKLQRVLWLPIEAEKSIPLAARTIGQALLWSPTTEQNAVLENDWAEFMERIEMGAVESITASLGQYLQVRPKAAHSQILTDAIDSHGAVTQTLPRGFYLRTSFTNEILKSHYHPQFYYQPGSHR